MKNQPKKVEELTDREIQEKMLLNTRKIDRNTERTANNLQFFFWFTLAGIVLAIIISANA